MALKVYQGCGSSTKIIGALAEKGDIAALVRLCADLCACVCVRLWNSE